MARRRRRDPADPIDCDLSRLGARPDLIDGGNEIYTHPFPFWCGETGEFDVQSLEGIDRLINLKRIEIISLLSSYDLQHLARLKNSSISASTPAATSTAKRCCNSRRSKA